jgi:hypothetical protein
MPKVVRQASLAASADSDPAAATEAREFSDALTQALQALDPRDRLLVQLHFTDGVSIPRIAMLMKFATPFHAYRPLTKVASGRFRPGLDACTARQRDPVVESGG